MLNPSTSREISRRAWAIFWIGSLGFVLSMFYRMSITVISPELTLRLESEYPSSSASYRPPFSMPSPSARFPIGMALDLIGHPGGDSRTERLAGLSGAVFFAPGPNGRTGLLGAHSDRHRDERQPHGDADPAGRLVSGPALCYHGGFIRRVLALAGSMLAAAHHWPCWPGPSAGGAVSCSSPRSMPLQALAFWFLSVTILRKRIV